MYCVASKSSLSKASCGFDAGVAASVCDSRTCTRRAWYSADLDLFEVSYVVPQADLFVKEKGGEGGGEGDVHHVSLATADAGASIGGGAISRRAHCWAHRLPQPCGSCVAPRR